MGYSTWSLLVVVGLAALSFVSEPVEAKGLRMRVREYSEMSKYLVTFKGHCQQMCSGHCPGIFLISFRTY